MSRRSHVLSVGLFAIVAIAVSWAAADDAVPTFKASKNAFKGKLIGFDSERNLIRLAKGSSSSATLVIDKNVKVIVDYQPSDRKLTDLPPDTIIGAVLNPDRTTLVEAHAFGPVVVRTVKSIDLEERTLHVVLGKKDEALPFVKGTKVTKTKADATLDDVKPGDRVSLQLSVDKTKVLTIEVLPPKSKN